MGSVKRLAVCLLVGVVAAATFQRIIYRAIWEFGGYHYPPPVYGIVGVVMVVAAALILSRRVAAKSEKILGVLIALDLTMFGWQKLLHQQGHIPLGRLDEALDSFSGEDLTWAFFGHSFPYFCLIGILQIVGALLLLFPRTRLLGAIFLLPLVLNIFLLNIFYGFEAGDTAHSLILLAGLSFLILRHYRVLAAFFFTRGDGPDGRNGPLRENVALAEVRLRGNVTLAGAVVLAPLLLVLSFRSPDRNPQLTGKYRVEGAGELTNIYFDYNNEIVLEFKGPNRKWIGQYTLDRATGALNATWRFPAQATDTRLVAKLDELQAGEWRIKGVLGTDSLAATLMRERTGSY